MRTQDAKSRLLAGLSFAALAVVVIAPAAASWHGLVETAQTLFGLTGGWEYLAPITLDGAALYAGTLGIRAILAADSAFGARFLTAVYAMAAAGFNAYRALHIPGTGNVPAALFFAGASLSAVVLWDVTLRALRRDQLRNLGAIEAPLPRWRLLRWVVAPMSTARAWRLAVIEQITDPAEALQLAAARKAERDAHRGSGRSVQTARAERVTDVPALPDGAGNEGVTTDEQEHDADAHEERPVEAGESAGARSAGLDGDQVPDGIGARGEGDLELAGNGSERDRGVPARTERQLTTPRLSDLDDDGLGATLRAVARQSKKDAVRLAFDHLARRDVPAALALLKEHGVDVDRSYAYTVPWTPQLRAVGTN